MQADLPVALEAARLLGVETVGGGRSFAAALDAGATLVLGAHPHVLQPIERRGRRLVAWSLGNFVFAPHSPGTDRTGVLLVRLGARGVLGYTLRPARIVGVQSRLS